MLDRIVIRDRIGQSTKVARDVVTHIPTYSVWRVEGTGGGEQGSLSLQNKLVRNCQVLPILHETQKNM